MPLAVIFDFDGVIADTELLHYKAFNVLFADYGLTLPKDKYWQDYLGYTDRECLEAVSRDFGLNLDTAGINKIIEDKSVVFDKIVREEGALIDGVVEFITMLHDNNVPMAICSGALRSDIDSVLGSKAENGGLDLRNFFQTIVTADDVVNGKPSPDGYLLTLERLNGIAEDKRESGECVVIEDSHWGIEAAHAAGMNVVAVTNSYPESELTDKADIVVDNLRKIKLDQLNRMLK